MTCCRSLQHHPTFIILSNQWLKCSSMILNLRTHQSPQKTPSDQESPQAPQTRKTHRPANIAQLLSMYFPNQDPPYQGPHKFHKSASGVSGFIQNRRSKGKKAAKCPIIADFRNSVIQDFNNSVIQDSLFTKFPVLAAIRAASISEVLSIQ